jgi:N-methylhydantoinase A
VSIERGHDPRDFTLVAFGGAGAMHACELARSLRIPRVLVPAHPGALSALGILISDVVKDHSRTVLLRVPGGRFSNELKARMNGIYAELQQRVAVELASENWQGRAAYERSADLRYRGQGFELSLPFGPDVLTRFAAEHKRRYGYSDPERDIEIVTVRVRGRVASPEKLEKMRVEEEAGKLQAGSAEAYFGGRNWKTQIIPRGLLRSGKRMRGPAIVTEYSATTVVPPGLTFQADRVSNLLIEVE